jgi:hypothetical protein
LVYCSKENLATLVATVTTVAASYPEEFDPVLPGGLVVDVPDADRAAGVADADDELVVAAVHGQRVNPVRGHLGHPIILFFHVQKILLDVRLFSSKKFRGVFIFLFLKKRGCPGWRANPGGPLDFILLIFSFSPFYR